MTGYYAEILQNPGIVAGAKAFSLHKIGDRWECSISLTERQLDELVEELEAHN